MKKTIFLFRYFVVFSLAVAVFSFSSFRFLGVFNFIYLTFIFPLISIIFGYLFYQSNSYKFSKYLIISTSVLFPFFIFFLRLSIFKKIYYWQLIIYFIYVIVLLYFIIKNKVDWQIIKKTFLVKINVALLMLTIFFSFSPIKFSVYRNIAIYLNQDNDTYLSKLLSYDYKVKSLNALNNKNYEEAVKLADLSVLYANNFAKIYPDYIFNQNQLLDTLNSNVIVENILNGFFNNEKNIKSVEEYYYNLFKISKAAADYYKENENWHKASINYLLAANTLNVIFYDKTLTHKIANNYFDAAKCSEKLNQYDVTDSLVNKAINILITNKSNSKSKSLLENFTYDYALILHNRGDYINSNAIIDEALSNLNTSPYKFLILKAENEFLSCNLYESLNSFEQLFQKKHKLTIDQKYTTCVYYGSLLYNTNRIKESINIFSECLNYAIDNDKKQQLYFGLAKTYHILGDIVNSAEFIRKGLNLTENNTLEIVKFNVLSALNTIAIGDTLNGLKNLYSSISQFPEYKLNKSFQYWTQYSIGLSINKKDSIFEDKYICAVISEIDEISNNCFGKADAFINLITHNLNRDNKIENPHLINQLNEIMNLNNKFEDSFLNLKYEFITSCYNFIIKKVGKETDLVNKIEELLNNDLTLIALGYFYFIKANLSTKNKIYLINQFNLPQHKIKLSEIHLNKLNDIAKTLKI